MTEWGKALTLMTTSQNEVPSHRYREQVGTPIWWKLGRDGSPDCRVSVRSSLTMWKRVPRLVVVDVEERGGSRPRLRRVKEDSFVTKSSYRGR